MFKEPRIMSDQSFLQEFTDYSDIGNSRYEYQIFTGLHGRRELPNAGAIKFLMREFANYNKYSSLVHSLGRGDGLTVVFIESGLDGVSVVQLDGATEFRLVRQGVLHPVDVVSFGVVVSGVGTSRLGSGGGGGGGLGGTGQQVLQFQGFDHVRVPDHQSVGGLDVLERLVDGVDFLDTLVQSVLGSEHGTPLLHGLLHRQSDLGGQLDAVSVSDLVEVDDRFDTNVLRHRLERGAGGQLVSDGVGHGSAEHDQVQQRVGPQSVGTVHRGTGDFTTGQQTGHNFVFALVVLLDHFTRPLGGDTTHVVVDGGQNGDGFLGDVDPGEDVGGFRDTGQSFLEDVGGDVRQLQVHVVLFGADTSAFVDFHGDGPRHHVSRRQVLGRGGVSFHESFPFRVDEETTFTSSPFSDQAPGTVDTRGVELHELHVFKREPGSRRHGEPVTSTGVGRGTREVGTPVPTGGQHRLVGAESVDGPVFLVVGDDPDTLAVLHQQVGGEELDEEVGVVSERLPVQRVQQRVPGSVGDGTGSVGLATLTVLLRLTPESSLVDSAFVVSREGHPVAFQFVDGVGGFLGHVVDGVLVTKPIGTLDGVVHVPVPVVLVHVAEGGVDPPLGGDGVGSGGEQLRDTRRLEPVLSQAEGGPQTGTTGTDDDTVVFVVDHVVLLPHVLGGVDVLTLDVPDGLQDPAGRGKLSDSGQHTESELVEREVVARGRPWRKIFSEISRARPSCTWRDFVIPRQ